MGLQIGSRWHCRSDGRCTVESQKTELCRRPSDTRPAMQRGSMAAGAVHLQEACQLALCSCAAAGALASLLLLPATLLLLAAAGGCLQHGDRGLSAATPQCARSATFCFPSLPAAPRSKRQPSRHLPLHFLLHACQHTPHLCQQGRALPLQHGRHQLSHSMPHSVALICQQLVHLRQQGEQIGMQ